MTKKNENLTSLRLSGKFSKEDIDEKAKAQGLPRSTFMSEGVDLITSFDPAFLKRIKRYSEKLKLPYPLVIQNLVIKRLAEDDARQEVYGKSKKVLDEFLFLDGRLLTGEDLYDRLKESKKTMLEKERYNSLKAIPKEDIQRLSLNDQEIIAKYSSKAKLSYDENEKEWTSEPNL